MWSEVIVCILLCVFIIKAQDVGDQCKQDNNNEGICSMVTDCEPALREIQLKSEHDFKTCGYDDVIEIVCCPSLENRFGSTETSLATSHRKADRECQKILDSPLSVLELYIIGGEAATLGEFPHMVALGYDKGDGYIFECGGSVISKNYVLTAAHCVDTLESIEPSVVRTGVVQLGGKVWDDETDVGIAKIIKHPNHRRNLKYNDLALLRLNKTLNFTHKLNAACLDTSEEDPAQPLVVTGWGITNNTDFHAKKTTTLQKASVNVMPSEPCGKSYSKWGKSLPQGIVGNQLCAGHPEGKTDSCQGDSGGPLQISISKVANVHVHRVVGVTSFGRGCGSHVPGVYTRVANYIDWIERIVWP